ncbi:MAG TPA: patatin-like phospholipase family protein [Acidocella sp.]|uniref:patatin-like phospholipase family protein n=1 Tax=Acidocella sp. TaxID=50710 RepID=UPI002C36353F|nr:patatin-like phospholipase family protein [Acidocella sp.]HVE20676.1 patatin-like phospholipase family protein [Acidocella sp.]
MDVLTDPHAPHRKPLLPIEPLPRPEGVDRIGLVLQGGGALGAYQAGVYQALHEAGLEPDWVVGVSIGAINSAIIAGNPPEERLRKLERFWLDITARDPFTAWPAGDTPRRLRNMLSAVNATLFGQPGFFRPTLSHGWLAPRGSHAATSLYDTSPLYATLGKLVDFNRINNGEIRFAVGAVNVASANFIYFDNKNVEIAPEHIMASGALPPALPMVRIGRDYFWDGGLVSNTPLYHLLRNTSGENVLVFQVDLFSAQGSIPRDMADVLSRQKDIQYSSRTRIVTDYFQETHQLKQDLRDALNMIPDEELSEEQRHAKAELERLPEINIMQLIYHQKAYEGDAKDYEFSRISMKEHWRTGYYDTRNTLAHKDWLTVKDSDSAITTHDIHRHGE